MTYFDYAVPAMLMAILEMAALMANTIVHF
jgi:hypothetical protein